MRFPFDPECLPTAVGSMPHRDAEQACSLVLRYLPQLPAWPQLPKRSFGETMYAQFAQGLPGLVVEGDRLYLDTTQDIDVHIQKLLQDWENRNSTDYSIAPQFASGLHAFVSRSWGASRLIKGQITGPVSMGLTLTDQERRPIIYHDILSDALAKHLRLKASWQEQKLREVFPQTMLWVDEPYMSAFGSGYLTLSREQVISLIEEVLGGIQGIKGIHCCGNTDWSVLLSTSIDVLDYDTYNYAETLSLYPEEVKQFLGRGGVIGWGIVPNDAANLRKETPASLKDRLEEALSPFARKGIPVRELVRRSLLTPSCGLASLEPDAAVQALETLAQLSQLMRKRYVG